MFPEARYKASECCVFFKTKEQWGQFSNMCGGFPITLQGVRFRTSEALYQALRFPGHPEIQREIIDKSSPMNAKFTAKREVVKTRPDWDDVRVAIMHYSVAVKLDQNPILWETMEESGDRPIVERSRKDPFWGALLDESTGVLTGQNVLGNLIMGFRQDRRDGKFQVPPAPEGCLLLGTHL